jgi:hypothetical protein
VSKRPDFGRDSVIMKLDDLALDYESLIHFTPTADQRRAFAKSGAAMPDGSFYITNSGQLSDAIRAVGRATPNAGESETARRNSVRRHIIKRARALNLANMVPDTWNSDGTLKQSATLADEVESYLSHFGVKGMRWGVRRSGSSGGGSRPSSGSAGMHHPSLNAPRPRLSSDAATAKALSGVVKTHGTQALSNKDLQTLVTRMNLEKQFTSLNPQTVSAGRKFTSDVLQSSGKQLASQFIAKNAPKGAAWVAKKIGKRAAVVGASLAVRAAVAAL